jgi:hypothetical protein
MNMKLKSFNKEERQQWHDFREYCFERNDWRCQHCGKHMSETTLQLHYPYYEDGRMPWEYSADFCVVLCKGCNAREHGKIKPLDGWVLIHSDWDEGHPSGSTRCDHCDTPMEWHHDLYHPDWGTITVGYECAERLGLPELHALKKRWIRMNTFINSPRWKSDIPPWNPSAMGWRYKYGGHNVLVAPRPGGWRLFINRYEGRFIYKTVELAKARAFHVLESKAKHSRKITSEDAEVLS